MLGSALPFRRSHLTVELSGRFGAYQSAAFVSPLESAYFQCAQEGATDPAEPRVGRRKFRPTFPASVTDPTASISSSSTATSSELSAWLIQATRFSTVLLPNHLAKIAGSRLWPVSHNSAIDRLSTMQAAGASSGKASRIFMA